MAKTTNTQEIDDATIDKTEVELIATHDHRGEPKQPGDKISISQRQAEWLRREGKVA